MVQVHTAFDLIAALSSVYLTAGMYRWRLKTAGSIVEQLGVPYALALVSGALIGGYGLGTLNLGLSGIDGIGRSVVGALAGAIAGVEIFKLRRGIRGSTGLMFVPAFAASVVIGRWGCFFAGLEDQTYGIASSLPWAHDFGDGVPRHPVQLYESFAMLAFLAIFVAGVARRSDVFMSGGFYLMVTWYGAQRFLWEFMKPYAVVAGPFNVFHFLCAGLVLYGLVMLRRVQLERADS